MKQICLLYLKNYKKIMIIYNFFHDKDQLQVLVAFKIVKMPKVCLLYDIHSLARE